jgi:hypothetical protein
MEPGAPDWSSYEELTLSLVARLAERAPVTTTRLERDVELRGLATVNRVDVLWEFSDGAGRPMRVAFECRSYKRPINQQALHSWRSVVDDVSTPGTPTVGVMVTRAGYQSGARRVAETYGVIILELRNPDPRDLHGRLSAIHVTMEARTPAIRDLRIDSTDYLGDEAADTITITSSLEDLELVAEAGERVSVVDALLAGELDPIDGEPTPFHLVTRTYEPPIVMLHLGRPLVRVKSITATVGETAAAPTAFIVGGLEDVAYMLKETLGGRRVWFAADGRQWTSAD